MIKAKLVVALMDGTEVHGKLKEYENEEALPQVYDIVSEYRNRRGGAPFSYITVNNGTTINIPITAVKGFGMVIVIEEEA